MASPSGNSGLTGRGEQTGLLVAAAVAPGTFEPSLVPRSLLDQGIVTGLATTLSYVMTVATQDAIEAVATTLAPHVPGDTAPLRQRRAILAIDLAVIPVGLLAQRALPRRPGERVLRGVSRQAGWRATATGLGGVLFALAETGSDRLDELLQAGGRIARFPIAIPAGLGLALVIEARRRRELPDEPAVRDTPQPSVGRAAAAALGVTTALTAAAYGEHVLARSTGAVLSAQLPGPDRLWRLAGHAFCLGGIAFAGTTLFQRAMLNVEAGSTAIEPVLDGETAARWVGETVSGASESLIAWQTLGREGRRHAFSYVRPTTVPDRPEGLPDLSIETVMGAPAKAAPIQVYVGLDSAPTARERVDLALAEMDRTGAWDRELLMLVSPTGTGYVNYCAVAAAQYLARGDVATVTLQYSKRPSPLSLFKVKDAREQNRLLWLRVSERLRQRKAP